MTITRAEIFDVVENAALEIMPDLERGELATVSSLRDVGADSLDRVEILNLSLEKLGLETPLHHFASVSTIADLVDALWARAKTRA